MADQRTLDANEWLGFGSRITFWHRLAGIGVFFAFGGILPTLIGGFPLLSENRDPDYDACVITFCIGSATILSGLIMLILGKTFADADLKRGSVRMRGVVWNRGDSKVLSGNFRLIVSAARPSREQPLLSLHDCSGISIASVNSKAAADSHDENPLLKIKFGIGTGIRAGSFAGHRFHFWRPDTILYANSTVTRIRENKIEQDGICLAVARQLRSLSPRKIPVEIVFEPKINMGALPPQSNAGVTGALLFGAAGGVIGGAMQAKRDKERSAAMARQRQNIDAIFMCLRSRCEELGWTLTTGKDAKAK